MVKITVLISLPARALDTTKSGKTQFAMNLASPDPFSPGKAEFRMMSRYDTVSLT
jgi:hypothetical protein